MEEKLVTRTPRLGVSVIDFSPAKLGNLFAVREALEGLAAKLAAERITDKEIAHLRWLLDRHGQHDDVVTGAAYYQVKFAEAVRRETGMPTMAVGLITEPGDADSVLRDGKADLIALGRAMPYNPRWAWHAAETLGSRVSYPVQYDRAHPSMRTNNEFCREAKPLACRTIDRTALRRTSGMSGRTQERRSHSREPSSLQVLRKLVRRTRMLQRFGVENTTSGTFFEGGVHP